MKRLPLLVFFLVVGVAQLRAQYFIDIFSFNRQAYSVPNGPQSSDLFVNAVLPKVLKNGNSVFIRANYEKLTLQNDSLSNTYSSFALPIGAQVQMKNPKVKFSGLVVPKKIGRAHV